MQNEADLIGKSNVIIHDDTSASRSFAINDQFFFFFFSIALENMWRIKINISRKHRGCRDDVRIGLEQLITQPTSAL